MIKRALLIMIVSLGMLVGVAGSRGYAAFDPLQGACTGGTSNTSNPQTSAICKQNQEQATNGNSNPIAGSNGVIQKATNLIAVISGVIGVVMIIVSGFTLITAGGAQGGGDNPNKVKKARGRIMASLIGLVIIALAWTIVTFIIQKFVK